MDSLAAECAARLALATNEDYSENPLNKYADLEESLANLKRALQDAAKAVEAEEAAIEGEARTLHEVEADMRACTQRLLAGDTTVASKLEALDLRGTQITDAGCTTLAAALDSGALPALDELGLEDNPASEAAQEAVHVALARSRGAAQLS